MKFIKFLAVTMFFAANLVSIQARDKQSCECAAEVECLIRKEPYHKLYSALKPDLAEFQSLVEDLLNKAAAGEVCGTVLSPLNIAYIALRTKCRDFVLAQTQAKNPRIVVCQPDGVVIVDTFLSDTDIIFGNSCANWSDNGVALNKNTRVAFFDAQLFPCGLGLETKFSPTTKTNQHYVAVRLGKNLNNTGTVRYSVDV